MRPTLVNVYVDLLVFTRIAGTSKTGSGRYWCLYCKAPLGHRGDQAVVCKSHRVRIQKPRLLSSQYFIILGTPHVYTRGAAGQIMELFGICAVVSLGATASALNKSVGLC